SSPRIFCPQLSQTLVATFMRDYGVRGHVRALKAATCRRTPKRLRRETLRVYSCPFVVTCATQKLNAAVHPQRLPVRSRCEQSRRAIARGSAGESDETRA